MLLVGCNVFFLILQVGFQITSVLIDRLIMMLTGSRITPTCGNSGQYYAAIDECVDLSIASLPAFVSAIFFSRQTADQTVMTSLDLEALRYVDTISGSLYISASSADADFSSLYDLKTVTGLFLRKIDFFRCT